MNKGGYIYIMASASGTLYIGVTANLERRVYEHQHGLHPGFTKKYNCNKLVYFEQYSDIQQAIIREKQLKGIRRERKEELIRSTNPHWNDLSTSC